MTIAALPDDGGAAITDVEYRVDGAGAWSSLPSYAGTGTYTITMAAAGNSYDIELRAVNSVGDGPAGNTETATSGAGSAGPAVTYSDDFSTDTSARYATVVKNKVLAVYRGT